MKLNDAWELWCMLHVKNDISFFSHKFMLQMTGMLIRMEWMI